MDNLTRLLMQGAAGAAGGGTYVDDVFSTFLYTGNNTARSINNGIDLAGEGGMVWTKIRNQSYYGPIADTERGIVNGATKILVPSSTDAQGDYANTSGNQGITSFNSNGYSLGAMDQLLFTTPTIILLPHGHSASKKDSLMLLPTQEMLLLEQYLIHSVVSLDL